MSVPADDLAPLRQTLVDLLATLRADAGLTQKQVGERVGYARVTVATAETGHRVPGEDFWSRCDVLFGAGGVLHGAYTQFADARRERARGRARAERAGRDARLAARRPPGGEVGPAGGGAVDRRDLLRAGVAAGAGGASVAAARLADVLLSDSLACAGLAGVDVGAAPVPVLRRRVDQLWRRYQAGMYRLVWAELPDVLRVVRALDLAGTPQPAAAADVVCRGFQLAASLAYKAGDPAVGLLAAERGLAAAARAGDRLLGGVAVTRVAHGLRGTGRHDQAAELALRAAASLQAPQRGDRPGRRSVYGALLLHAAMAAAHRHDAQACRSLLADAAATAARCGQTNYYWTAFGPDNVTAWTVAAHLRLGEAPHALAAAGRVQPQLLPVAERRAHFLLDKATAAHHCGHHGDAVDALLAAEQTAPDEVHSLPAARQLAAGLLPAANGEAHRCLRALAARMSLPA